MGLRDVRLVPGPTALIRAFVNLTYSTLTGCFDAATSTYPGRLVTRYVGNVSSLLAKCVVVWLICTILLISSAVLYFTFHYSMMPTMLVTIPAHFQFTPCYTNPGQCTYPRAQVYLLDREAGPLLHPHVHYTITVEMDMPESRANKDSGMFMLQMNLTSFSGALVGSSSRANILHYSSQLLRALRTVLLCPLLLTEYSREQQSIHTQLFSAYLVHEEQPPTSAWLELRSHTVQLYGARLRVHARLAGLRRLMYQYPLVAGVVGTAAVFCSLSAVFLLLWLRTTDLPDKISQLKLWRLTAAGSEVSVAGGVDAKKPDILPSSPGEKSPVACDKGQRRPRSTPPNADDDPTCAADATGCPGVRGMPPQAGSDMPGPSIHGHAVASAAPCD